MDNNNEVEALKNKLRKYEEKDIIFNEPHFTTMLLLREGARKDVIRNLIQPDNLVYFYEEKRTYGGPVYNLYFRVSSTRTMKLPAIIDKDGKKSLYILTYIMRYRPWQSMIQKVARK